MVLQTAFNFLKNFIVHARLYHFLKNNNTKEEIYKFKSQQYEVFTWVGEIHFD